MSGSSGTKRLLGRILLDGGLVSPADLELALAEQQKTGEMLGEVLVRLSILDAAQIKASLATQEYLGSMDSALKTAAGPRDKLGLMLCKSGYLSEDTLDDALTLQKATGEKLGEILIRIGVINGKQLDALLQFQKNQENAPMEGGPLKLGELLVTTGAITREQLTEAIGSRRQASCKIGEILIEKGFITSGQIEYFLNLQQKLVAASLLAVLSLGLSACGGGGGGNEPISNSAVAANLLNPNKQSNYLTLSIDEYGLATHNFYASTNNAEFWSIQASIANDIHDINALTIIRIDIQKNGTPLPALNKTFSIEETPIAEKFPGEMLIFNGQKTTGKKVESGTITFTPNSDASTRVQGTFDVVMTDYDASKVNPPHYRIKGDFSFQINTYGPS